MNQLIFSLNECSAVLVPLLWKASWQGGLALLLTLAVVSAIRRIPAHVQCWLWRLAYLKLLVAAVCIVPLEVRLLPPPSGSIASITDETSADMILPATIAKVPHDSPAAGTDRLHVRSWLFLAWLLGVTLSLAHITKNVLRVRRQTSTLTKVTDVGVQQLVVENRRQLSLRSTPELRVSRNSAGPFLVGILRPTIVLPSLLLRPDRTVELQTALVHELAHIKRRDLVWNWVPAVAEIIFFFHPVLWLVRREWRLSQEIATDELVLSAWPVRPDRYARSLIEILASCRTVVTPHLTMSVSETHARLSRRIIAMHAFKQTAAHHRMIMVAVLLAIAVVAIVPWKLTAQQQDEPASLSVSGETVKDAQNTAQPWTEIERWSQRHNGSYHPTTLVIWNVDDDDLAELHRLKNPHALARVLSLYIRGANGGVSNKGLKSLSDLVHLHNLASLFIENASVTNEGLAHLQNFSQLRKLTLANLPIDDGGMEYLRELQTVRNLTVARMDISNEGLRVLCDGFDKLSSLSVMGTQISDDGLGHLAKMSQLKQLDLGRTKIGDIGLRHVADLPLLQRLNLRRTLITDDGLEKLRPAPELRSLNLEATGVTDVGITALADCVSLMEVTLSGTDVTRAGFERLQELNPNITISFSPLATLETSR